MGKDTPHEPQVAASTPMPPGYCFVRKGDVYITKNCRKRTHEAGKALYVVVNNRQKPIGLRCPKSIYNAVMQDHRATAEQRAQAVKKRDTAVEEKFEEALVRLYPKTPKDVIPQIIQHSLKKRSRRVGRTSKVDLDDKVKLAVRAHIRHVHTDYEKLLQSGESREKARLKVWKKMNEVAAQWGGPSLVRTSSEKSAKRRRSKDKKKKKGSGPIKSTSPPANVSKSVACGQQRPVFMAGAKILYPRENPIEISSDEEEAELTSEESDELSDSDWSDWSDPDGDFEYP